MKTWNVEDQRIPFEIPGTKRRVEERGRSWTECDHMAHMVWVGTVEAEDAKQAIQRAKDAGLSRAPVVSPAELTDDEMEEIRNLLSSSTVH